MSPVMKRRVEKFAHFDTCGSPALVIWAAASDESLKFGVQRASATNWFPRVIGTWDNGIRLYHTRTDNINCELTKWHKCKLSKIDVNSMKQPIFHGNKLYPFLQFLYLLAHICVFNGCQLHHVGGNLDIGIRNIWNETHSGWLVF